MKVEKTQTGCSTMAEHAGRSFNGHLDCHCEKMVQIVSEIEGVAEFSDEVISMGFQGEDEHKQ